MIAISGSKRCPRCNGNLGIEYDYTAYDIVCLQCGYRKELLKIKGGLNINVEQVISEPAMSR